MKKIIFALSFLVLSGLFFGLTTSEVKAITLSELQTHITRLQAQVIELQRLLSEISGIQVPETGIEPKATDRTEDFAPGRLIVRFKDNVPESTQAEILKAHGLTIKGEIKQLKVKIVSVPEKAEERLAQALSSNPNIKWAEPDYVAEIQLIPNDPYFDIQWGLEMVQAPEAWDITTGSSDVVIAILDTGIDTSHPDLKDKIVASVNFTNSPTVEDIRDHGTHVAGIAAASTNNAIGIAGLGYDSSLMNVKVLGDKGSGLYSWIVEGIVWAADNGAHVINMSLGGPDYSSLEEDAVNYAWDKGLVVVAAAGNSGVSSPFYPAAFDNCIAVAAITQTETKPNWSNYGDWVNVAAPGSGIYATVLDNNYWYKSGTSMASPHVAGLAGLLSAIAVDTNKNGFINDEIRFIIENTTDPLDWGSYSIANGRINAFSAVRLVDDIDKLYALTVSSTDGGSVINPGERTSLYQYGAVVDLRAVADSNYIFTEWTGDTDTIANTKYIQTTITIEGDYSITANFKQAPECTTYNGNTYCRGFRSTDSQGSSCNAACSERGYICPVGDNMFSSVLQVADVATALGLLDPGESYQPSANADYYSPYIVKRIETGYKWLYYDPNWNQVCTHAPGTSNLLECVKICLCQESVPIHTLSVAKLGTGSGTITSNPAGINCGNTCSATYQQDTSVTLTATPDNNSTFVSWSGACTGTSTTCTVAMDSNKSVTAAFDQITHALSVNSLPVTGISITSATGHSGTTNYTKTVEEGTSVSLTAPSNHVIPGSNIAYDFVSWSGTGCSSENTTVNLEMTSDIICTANYKKSITTHTLSISSTANGSVINPGQGNFSYNQGETVSLLAVADLGYRFINWTGDTNTISNTEHSQTTITIEGDYSITANFKQTPECTTYNGNTYCRGFKSTDPQGSSCQAACSARGYSCPTGDNMFRSLLEVSQVAVELGLLGYGESYHSRASAFYYSPYIRTALSSGDRYIFYDSGWNQSCTNAPLSSATYERIKICLCQESLPSYTLSVSKSGTGSGTVTSEPQGISCGTTCSAFFDQATYVTLTATADSNSTFKGWSGDCTGTTCTIEMKSNKSATAVFDIIESPPLPQGCINYKGYIYCRGFKSTDPQGSSCHAACSARGYSCPTGDNMLRSVLEVNEAAVLLGLLASRERYGLGERASHYSPYIRKTLTTGAKHIYYDPNWNQSCSHAPLSDSNYERIKICRCQQVSSPQALTYVDNQLASLNNIVSNLIDQLRGLIGKQ